MLSLLFDERHGHFDRFFYPKTHAPGVFFESFCLCLRLWRFAYLCLIRPKDETFTGGLCLVAMAPKSNYIV